MAAQDERSVRIPADGALIQGDLVMPEGARALVVFAHGSGSGRHSPRNRYVAEGLHEGGIATLLIDLLTEEEERVDTRTRQHRFDIELLAGRLEAALAWLGEQPDVGDLPTGLFGASTGAGAALIAAARRPERVGAVVSRGGRPDLAGDALDDVRAPTLLIVGERDEVVLDLNEEARRRLPDSARLEVVPAASHLFEEAGALEVVIRSARDWFDANLVER
jgi:dienelactone hydrolase